MFENFEGIDRYIMEPLSKPDSPKVFESKTGFMDVIKQSVFDYIAENGVEPNALYLGDREYQELLHECSLNLIKLETLSTGKTGIYGCRIFNVAIDNHFNLMQVELDIKSPLIKHQCTK